MILDLGSFTRSGLMVEVSALQKPEVTKRGKSRGCKTRKEVVEDRETTDLSAMGKWQAHRLRYFGDIEKRVEKKKERRTGSTGRRKFKKDEISVEWKNKVFLFVCLF